MADKNKTNGTMADGKAVNGRIAKHRSTLKRILDYIGVYKWLVLLSLVGFLPGQAATPQNIPSP